MAQNDQQILKELVAIKKLLILALAKSGMTQSQIASALDVDRTNVSRMFPKGTLASVSSKGDKND